MAKFKFTQTHPIRADIDGRETILSFGGVYELPEKNPYIAALLKRGYIERVNATKPRNHKPSNT